MRRRAESQIEAVTFITRRAWLGMSVPTAAGVIYRGSVEVEESKHPMRSKAMRVVQGGAGAGHYRGVPGVDVVFGPRRDTMMAVASSDGHINASRGVQGGHDGRPGKTFKVQRDGTEESFPAWSKCALNRGNSYAASIQAAPATSRSHRPAERRQALNSHRRFRFKHCGAGLT